MSPANQQHPQKKQQIASPSSRIITATTPKSQRLSSQGEESHTDPYNAASFPAIPPTILLSLVVSALFSLILINQSLRFQHDFAALQYTTRRSIGGKRRGASVLLNDHYVEYLQQTTPSTTVSTPIQWKNRNYATHPVTPTESNYLDAMAAEHARKMNRGVISAAICHPTIYDKTGSLNLDPFFAWVSYYRLLGFQHIFLWYEGNVDERPRFQELAALPYVTLTRYVPTFGGKQKKYHGQGQVERECMSDPRFAANYSWALPLDADEYLWLEKPQSIQDFLAYYEAQNYVYISLGKYHYSTIHIYNNGTTADDDDDSGFGLDKYPFTPGPYCYKMGGKSNCPTWHGRCKVLAKPSRFETVHIHGTRKYHEKPDGIHLDTSVAHFKEWSWLLAPRNANDTVHYHYDTQSFHVTKDEQANIQYLMEAHKMNIFGEVKMDFDPTLHDWFQFVAQGCPVTGTASSSSSS